MADPQLLAQALMVPKQPLPQSFYNPEETNPLVKALMKEPSIPNPSDPPHWARQAVVDAVRPVLDAGQWLGGVMGGNVQPTMGDAVTNLGGAALAGIVPPGVRAAGAIEREAVPAAESIAKGIRAYHGSPYDFDRFDLSKIGTGEGAQVYGHGLYFAENPTVAQDYKTKFVQDVPGKTYEVNINANPEHFLDWDKPLSEQSEHVREAIISKLWEINPQLAQEAKHADLAGQQILHRLSSDVDQKGFIRSVGGRTVETQQATGLLREAGIPGIKYLDQGSREKGEGTNNYVVFDPEMVKIVKKYGIAGLGAYLGQRGLNSPDSLAKGLSQ